MSGRFIAVVGPSGVGKDSVMRAMAEAEPRLTLARRVITRPSDAGGEEFDGVTSTEFEQMQQSGRFALSWPAHGLLYGIPKSVDQALELGQDVLANLSRAMLLEAKQRFAAFEVLLLEASPDVLRRRLLARQREQLADIESRLARADFALPEGVTGHKIWNDGPIDQTVAEALRLFYPARE